jgi:hypothetical protein
LSEQQILAWADAFHARTGRWPHADPAPIENAPGETWGAVDDALRAGLRGMDGGSSLAKLLAARRGLRHRDQLPRLTIGRILAWAKAHKRRTGRWPGHGAGAIPEAPGESWNAVGLALKRGTRGLPGGQSLVELFRERGGGSPDETR